jgi:hypothetical protein
VGSVAPAASAAVAVEAEVAASGLRLALTTAASGLMRFAGVIGAIYTAYEVADFVADVTGLKKRIKDLFVDKPEDNSPEARLARAQAGRGSFAEAIPTNGTAIDDTTQAPVSDFVKYHFGQKEMNQDAAYLFRPDGSRKSPYELKAEKNDAAGLGYGLTQPEQNAANKSGDGLVESYNKRIDAGQIAQEMGPDGKYNPAAFRNANANGNNSAPPVIDTSGLSESVERGVSRAIDKIATVPIVIGPREDVENLSRQRDQAMFAPRDAMPAGASR